MSMYRNNKDTNLQTNKHINIEHTSFTALTFENDTKVVM